MIGQSIGGRSILKAIFELQNLLSFRQTLSFARGGREKVVLLLTKTVGILTSQS